MKDELKTPRLHRLQQRIDQIFADFRRGFQLPQGPLEEPRLALPVL